MRKEAESTSHNVTASSCSVTAAHTVGRQESKTVVSGWRGIA